MSEELKPCPFCGCRATSITDAENVRITGSHSDACPFRDVDVIVDSRDAWNTRAELAALKAGQGEAVAEVLSNRIGNDTATIDKALWPGTKLYTAPPAPADARSVPVELLERVCVDRCYPAGHTMSIRAIDELRALLAQSQEVKS